MISKQGKSTINHMNINTYILVNHITSQITFHMNHIE